MSGTPTRRAVMAVAVLLLAGATQASKSPTELTAAAGAPVTPAHLALQGPIGGHGSGGALQLNVFLEPGAEAMANMQVGETLRVLELSPEAVTQSGNSFAVAVDPGSIPDGYVSDAGLVTMLVTARDASGETRGMTTSTVRRAQTHDGAYAWIDPDVPPGQRAEVALTRMAQEGAEQGASDPGYQAAIRGNLSMRPRTPAPPPFENDGSDEVSAAGTTLLDTSVRSTTIGTTYPIGTTKATMEFTAGKSTTTGVALNAGGYWKQDGTKSTDAGFGKEWLLSGDRRSYRVNIRYGKYRFCMETYGWCETTWEPMNHTGGTGHNVLSSAPDFKHCQGVDAGPWWRRDSGGYAYSYGAGVKFKSVINIDLSSRRQYSTGNKLLYDIPRERRMCGSNADPALASKVMERWPS